MPKKNDDYPTFTTPVGTLVFPFLNNPRDYEDDGKFCYMAKLNLPAERAAKLEAFVDKLLESGLKQFKSRKIAYTPYDNAVDDDGAVIDGVTRFAFKVPAETKTKKGKIWYRKPVFFQGDNTLYEDEPSVGGDTIASLAFQTYTWKSPNGVGVTLQPTACKIDTLVEYVAGGRDAGAYGWGEPAEGDDPDPDADDKGGNF